MFQLIPLIDKDDTQLMKDYKLVMYGPPRRLQQLSVLFEGEPSVQACFSLLVNALAAGGMNVEKKGFVISRWIKHLLDTNWMTCGRSIIRSAWTHGLVIVDIDYNTETPYVIDPLQLIIHFVYNYKGERYFRLRKYDEPLGESVKPYLTTPLVFAVDDIRFTGEVRSKMNCLLPLAAFQNQLIGCASKANDRNSAPAVYTEAVQENLFQQDLDRNQLEFNDRTNNIRNDMADSDLRAMDQLISNEDYGRRVQYSGRYSYEPEDAIANLRDSGIDVVSGIMRYPPEPASEPFVNTHVAISKGRKLVQGQLAKGPDHLIDMLYITEADVSKVIGISDALWGSRRGANRVDENVMTVFNITLQAHKSMLSSIFTILLERIYGEQNHKHALQHLDSTKTLEQNMQDHSFQVTFNGIMDLQTLELVMQLGVMEWSELRKFWAGALCVREKQIAKKLVDVTTDEPLADAQEEEKNMQKEEHSMQMKTAKANLENPDGPKKSTPLKKRKTSESMNKTKRAAKIPRSYNKSHTSK